MFSAANEFAGVRTLGWGAVCCGVKRSLLETGVAWGLLWSWPRSNQNAGCHLPKKHSLGPVPIGIALEQMYASVSFLSRRTATTSLFVSSAPSPRQLAWQEHLFSWLAVQEATRKELRWGQMNRC